MTAPSHEEFMRQAAALAARGRGATAPNPCVGALLVRGGEVLARGWHRRCGGPHAEPECLADARSRGVDPAGCTLYVTLEPCNHQGRTPPCTRAILEAGIREVVAGMADPNPVAGGGAEFLRANGVAVRMGVEQALCRDLVADFLVWQRTDRPYVYLKLASTLDGRIATRTGHSRWISGPESRAAVHALRARCQAVIVGGGTLRADDPRLTVRLPGDVPAPGPQPLAVVVTSALPGPDDFALTRERPQETIFWTGEAQAATGQAEALRARGCRVWALPPAPGPRQGLDLGRGLARLREQCAAWYVLCEGGGSLALSFLHAGLMDEFRLFVAPKILADGQARPLMDGLAPQVMDQALAMRWSAARPSGEDVLLIYRPREDG
ncbi:bifunctional diaminohydroxyphosphoribosylaminopyrimidine deaminase/5-amino-6-(5-phosphoribosylamino)uracil reductase RibD [Desulfocurvus sp.]|uniref:bifunctional diaminohydroxyphosphoribosylaminopyrimidine deaminase/5-amino-6-(5-phosphoribosylamino)uracil reductase RibD n=1 Tax=Desulfocurvus sp. TaxID=2871698 RepID=UPI0025BFA40B|nr:bifunctional diaminohydroxyphosphoribosylaminopyrimidine deaminase/5-amino-6-(5-phosphoribosylamino)uracil reductase RibD [Desulfocurvus sp.]MCK9240362.1 bifunctional diaminohydroxyphosphoribosylaminopyrimidine deaminase/5-amino-6-(5-phosphoribosylamino)uracil reductase RibD [Desulfocurvus sp.]